MKHLLAKLWNDDSGALIATEFLFIATILVIGIVVGLTSVRAAVNAELTNLADAILALNMSFAFSGQSGCCAQTEGSQFIMTPQAIQGGLGPICIPPSTPIFSGLLPCQ
jgi:Flp pilus assembly pilin Flp